MIWFVAFGILHALIVSVAATGVYYTQLLEGYVFPAKRALPILAGIMLAATCHVGVAWLVAELAGRAGLAANADLTGRACLVLYAVIAGFGFFVFPMLDRDPLADTVKLKSFWGAVSARFRVLVGNISLFGLNVLAFGIGAWIAGSSEAILAIVSGFGLWFAMCELYRRVTVEAHLRGWFD